MSDLVTHGATAAQCATRDASGTLGSLDYLAQLEAVSTHYRYYWNELGQLRAAERYEDGSQKIAMAYRYDAGGNRVIREKSDVVGGELDNIRQDLYLGGYERRQVQLQDELSNPVSINDPSGVLFADVDGTRLVKYASGARIQWKSTGSPVDPSGTPQIFLTFANHLGSTSAVTDYANGNLVEWKTSYAYGADESGWKNSDPAYDNADEPYGFTGKEEDVDIGLHYFGARYYSSYTARWLGPDPPVVHGGGMSNHFAYGGDSPYIYVDPDGNFIQAIIGAIVGAVVGAVSAAVNGGDWKAILAGAVVGAVVGAVTGGVGEAVAAEAGTAAGVIAGAATSAACNMATTAAYGGSGKQILISGAVSFGTGLVSGALGSAIGTMGNEAGQAIAGYASSLAVSYAATGLTGGLNEDTWDDVLLSSSISYWGSYAGNAVGEEIESAGAGEKGNREICPDVEPGQSRAIDHDDPLLHEKISTITYSGEDVGLKGADVHQLSKSAWRNSFKSTENGDQMIREISIDLFRSKDGGLDAVVSAGPWLSRNAEWTPSNGNPLAEQYIDQGRTHIASLHTHPGGAPLPTPSDATMAYTHDIGRSSVSRQIDEMMPIYRGDNENLLPKTSGVRHFIIQGAHPSSPQRFGVPYGGVRLHEYIGRYFEVFGNNDTWKTYQSKEQIPKGYHSDW
jgi:RHS repeat-associated protein